MSRVIDQETIEHLVRMYEDAKAADYEVTHRAENRRTGGQMIRAEERFRTLEEVCKELGIIEKKE